MLSPFICGSEGFHRDQEDEPKRSLRKKSFCKRHNNNNNNNKNKNPYSSRGLDKFSALLADLDAKRHIIYSQLGPQETPLVRFVYTNSNDCVPIVVRLKDKKGQRKIIEKESTSQIDSSQVSKKPPLDEDRKRVGKGRFSWRRPAYYLPAAVILILVFLAVFGRSAAVMCTSIGWYLVPALNNGTRVSDKKTGARSACSSPTGAVTPRSSNHRKSF